MRIGSLQQNCQDSRHVLSATVEFQSKTPPEMPKILWFNVDSRYARALSADGMDSFLLALVFPAMLLGEPIELDGPVSAELVEGVLIVQQIFHAWYPELKPVPIHHRGRQPSPPQQVIPGNGFCFSGGVDSLHSLKSFLNHPDPHVRPTHLFYGMFGPPISWREQAVFQGSLAHYRPFVDKLGLALVTGSSNLSDFYWPLHLWWGHVTSGLATAAMAHLLPGLFGRFIIPSSHFHKHLHRNGSSPQTDPLLSSIWVRIINHGSSVTRVEKTVEIADWALAHHILNVCAKRTEQVMNCGRCEKCWRTMLTLLCIDSLEKFSTFPVAKNEQGQVVLSGWNPQNLISTSTQERFQREILEFAKSRGKMDVVAAIEEALGHYEKNKLSPRKPDPDRPYSWMRTFD